MYVYLSPWGVPDDEKRLPDAVSPEPPWGCGELALSVFVSDFLTSVIMLDIFQTGATSASKHPAPFPI